MRSKKWTCLVVLLVGASLVLAACPAPATPVAPAVQTVVVTVKETVVSQVEVTKVVETVKEVVATPTPEAKPKVLRVNMGAYPDMIDPQKSLVRRRDRSLAAGLRGPDPLEREAGDGSRSGYRVEVQRRRHSTGLHTAT